MLFWNSSYYCLPNLYRFLPTLIAPGLKGCLGSLENTYIDVRVPTEDRACYRTHKGSVSVHVLGVCDRNRHFIYALSEWEDNYYLIDIGYEERFLLPYCGVHYHVKEWESGRNAPQNHEKYFNMKYVAAPKGHLGVLQQMISKRLPGSGFKSRPNISSKIHVWKRTYESFSNMMGRNGFGWNEISHMIVVSDNVFESYLKTMRIKSFPYYPIWCEGFGKDKAIDPTVFVDEIKFLNSFASTTAHVNAPLSDTEHVLSKKQKSSTSSVDEKFGKKFDAFVYVTDDCLGDIAKRFGVEADELNARRQVNLDLFITMSDDAKAAKDAS
ncbi:UNVERIFIED_CONTAM: hypothetical protein Scaly_1926800 [Sesamum calycinum]|uniref:Myb/SANT-like domain-containing protein n=1 Tax=Sesamum calycinum TaxID=2727403 RepID=A0AAW2NI30_9LAMI